ncbi:MAG: MFS transporter [Phycisphaerae bacterium]
MVDTQHMHPSDDVSAVAESTTAAKTLDQAEIKAQIRRGRTRFLAMALAYAMGNFNDNFMKQSVSLLAVSHHLAGLQGWISVFYTLPFLMFAAPAGWMADRFSRRTVVIGAKLMELVFLSLGAWAILSLNWPVIITVIFLMAFQANIFGPALVGGIPDVYPECFVVEANSRLKSVITAAILVGIIAAGVALNNSHIIHLPAWSAWIVTRGQLSLGRLIAAAALVSVAGLGFLVSLGVPGRPAANPHAPFPWAGPVDSVSELRRLWPDRLLRWAIIADSYFWLVAVLQVLIINQVGIAEFHASKLQTSYLALAELIGVVVGSLVAGRITRSDTGLWAAAPAAAALAVFLIAIGAAPLLPSASRLTYCIVILAGAGIAGGIMMVPLESFFQTRPAAEHRGRVIAAAWFLGYVGILLGSLVYTPLSYFQPTTIFMVAGCATIPIALWLAVVFVRNRPGIPSWPARILCGAARCILPLRYRIKFNGIEKIAAHGKTGILFLPNHPALIDPVIVTTHLHARFAVRPLALETQINKPVIRQIAEMLGVLPIADVGRAEEGAADRAQQSIQTCIAALKRGENVLLYPAGRLIRSREDKLGSVSGAHQIVSALPDVRVVLVRTTGLWGSCFGWAGGKPPQLETGLIEHLPALLASGIFFAPRRDVILTFHEPVDLPRSADRRIFNDFLDRYYLAEAPPARYVPYSRWESGGPRDLPEPEFKPAVGGDLHIPPATREIITRYLRDETGVERIDPQQQLSADLGMDSLAVTDLIIFLEREFAVSVPSVEALQTVGDVMHAARGRLSVEAFDVRVPPPPPDWHLDVTQRAMLPPGGTIQEVFLKRALSEPRRRAAADLQRGVKTYRDLITAIIAMRKPVASLDGQYIGVLLPASTTADVVFLACLFAGKIPVMINWTAGQRNILHAMDLLGVKRILTSEMLVKKLRSGGIDLSDLETALVPLETFAASIGKGAKIFAAVAARVAPRRVLQSGMRSDPVSGDAPAVILFTSGSESLPKAVPLTHTNLLTNIRDALKSFKVYEQDCFLGMLPPFHSFGLTGAMLLPLLAGAAVIHYPNPNDVTTLAKLTARWRVSILLGTPTFISNILRAARDEDLSSVRLCVTGAEKCPPAVYDLLRSRCNKATILEGYGITECSPIVSVVRAEHPKPGSIGRPLPSVECAIVQPETEEPCAVNQTGMLLVRGPSIFSGYMNYQGPSPFVQWRGKPWYRTGDLVSIDDDGDLTFRGRLKRFVKIGGEMVSLPAIEEAIQACFPGHQDGPGVAVVSTPDDDQPELVLFTTAEIDRAAANEAIRAAGLSGLHNIRAVRHVDALPTLGTGKTDYRTLAELLKSDATAK